MCRAASQFERTSDKKRLANGGRVMTRSVLIDGLTAEDPSAISNQIQIFDESDMWTAVGLISARRLSGLKVPFKTMNWIRRTVARLPEDFVAEVGAYGTRTEAQVDRWSNALGSQIGRLAARETSVPDYLPAEDSLRLMKLCRLADAADLKWGGNQSSATLNELGCAIENKAIEYLKETDKEYRGDDIQSLMRHTLSAAFSDLIKAINNLPATEREERIADLIDGMSALRQKDYDMLLKELGVDTIDEATIRNLLGGTTFAGGLAAIVSVSGFSAYTTLTSVLAGTAGLVGVTLPFSTYIFATSLLAFLTNPLFLLGGGAAFALWATKKTNKKLRARMLPLLVSLSVVEAAGRGPDRRAINELADTANIAREFLSKNDWVDHKPLEKTFPGFGVDV